MPSLSDYLDFSVGDAKAQWQSILMRQSVVPGKRQVDFLPVETLMCLSASLVISHRKYGGSTSRFAAEPVPSLAKIFRRPNSSVLAKMANLDGSRSNGAKYEIEVGAAYLANLPRLASIYKLMVLAARDSGIGPSMLPDFLALEGLQDELLLLGQEELVESEVESSLERQLGKWLDRSDGLDPKVTEKLLVAAVRVGQHRFASQVLANHEYRCVFCGMQISIDGKRARRMLIAGHIKPWRLCDSVERLDPRNGLTGCPTHDVAFDTGLMSVDSTHRIILSKTLKFAVASGNNATRAAFGRPTLMDSILLPGSAPQPNPNHLEWHLTNLFQSA